ncbi:hypothetical protein AB0M12_13820 [Nocardia vinacea]|uniref:hypothetical protein n=1 Tax=Nocardia vinacea TaxID=96468 RepID=UPI0034322BEC
MGLAPLIGILALGITAITHRRYDAEQTLSDIQTHRATVFAGVPVTMQRLLDGPEDTRRTYDTGTFRFGGHRGLADLPGDLGSS